MLHFVSTEHWQSYLFLLYENKRAPVNLSGKIDGLAIRAGKLAMYLGSRLYETGVAVPEIISVEHETPVETVYFGLSRAKRNSRNRAMVGAIHWADRNDKGHDGFSSPVTIGQRTPKRVDQSGRFSIANRLNQIKCRLCRDQEDPSILSLRPRRFEWSQRDRVSLQTFQPCL